jgi:murein DD-endopeptidase MepM/ murein hydrolase activator NlpD
MFDIIKKFVAKQDWGVVGRIISAANFLDESSFQQFLSLLDKGQPVQVTPNRQLLTQTPQTGNRWIPIGGYAKGGPVDGPGSETSDSIPARLSNGEYVVSAKGVRQAGISTLNAINSGIGGVADVMFRQAIASGIASAVLKGRESAGSDFGPGGYGSPASESGNWAYPFAKKYPITSHYGARRGSRRHTGTDIGAPYGTPILAVNYGKVGYVGVDPSKASASQSFSGKVVPWMGNMVSVGHSGTVSSAYGHMSRFAPIEAGSTVRRGQILGYVGSTGNSTGPHLHLGMRNKNGRLNPEAIIPGLKNGAVIKYDNTLANLHRGESVLTAPLTKQMQDVASGAKIEYNVNVNVANANATPDDIDQAVYGALRRHELKMGYGRKIGR